jgi:hypothetical protein
MKCEITPYGGWDKALRLSNGTLELVVTLEVGPRIIRLAFPGQENEFWEYPEDLGKTRGAEYRHYGGHRLWLAPEARPRTYYPDNQEVSWAIEQETVNVMAPVETATGIQKSLHIRMADSNHIAVTHRLTNHGLWIVALAPWAISIMAPGGRAIIPQEAYGPQPENLLPARLIALWRYTDMGDPRLVWGRRFIQLRQDAQAAEPLKIGALNTLGWLAYARNRHLLLKTFPYSASSTYPDFGCNCEAFTNADMLEIESLGPLVTLEPGAGISHEEHWRLFQDIDAGHTDDDLQQALKPLLRDLDGAGVPQPAGKDIQGGT